MIACVESDGTKCTMPEKSGREWCDGLVHCKFHNIVKPEPKPTIKEPAVKSKHHKAIKEAVKKATRKRS